MTQHDMTIEDGPGLNVRENINSAVQALASSNSGSTEPATRYSGQLWLDTAIQPNGVLRMRNQLNSAWIGVPIVLPGGADVSFGTKLSPDRFVWNDKIDGSGIDVMTLSDTGALNARSGYVTKPGSGGTPAATVFNFEWSASSLKLWIDAASIGTVTVTSDYRVKKDVEDLPSMWDTLKGLRPVSYTLADYGDLFKADDVIRWGFIAHELQDAMIDDAATGHKDAENEIQSPNPWTLLAALVKTTQECQVRIEALEKA